MSVTNLSHSKFYLISLSQSNFQFLRQTRTYFENLAAESKQRFNEKLLEFLKSKRYNIGEDVSGYAQEHLDEHIGRLFSTNEIISEANTLDLLSKNSKCKSIINFLEKEDW